MNKTQHKYTNEVNDGYKYQVTSYLIDDKKFIELKKIFKNKLCITEKYEDKLLKNIRCSQVGYKINTKISSINNPTQKQRLEFIKKHIN